MELEEIPEYVGELTKPFGLNGFELADVGHPVFSLKDRYVIFLKSLTKTVEQKQTGNGGHEKILIDYNVMVPFYKHHLGKHIKLTAKEVE